ncbi:MAG: aspartate aminotransferase family protein [Planctomycetes bacterium]|nr:aspartate aminotransferase family protein [Planctomycetota bacterium]
MMDTTYRVPRIDTELPGPKARAILERDRDFVSPSYTRDYPLVVANGCGCWVEDVDGNLFLDMNAGIAVCATGHCHPSVVEAIKAQAESLVHMSGTDFYYESQVMLAEKLDAMTPGGPWRTFFGNSGAEAVECALKLARWRTERQLVISFEGAFHGRTMGALSLTASKPVHKERFFPLVPGVFHAQYGDAGSVERLLAGPLPPSELAAIFVEAVQGEGGYRVAPAGFLAELRAICDRTGAMLVVDEVQSGMGRTGRVFAYEHDGIEPDIICSAKGIASGMPLGVCIAKRDHMTWNPGAHASTFGGNPIACRAALATLDLLEQGLIANAEEKGALLRQHLTAATAGNSNVTDIRGRGLMLAVEVNDADLRGRIIQEAFKRGLLILGCGKKAVRFSPALVISEEEAVLAVNLFKEALTAAG